ncbi:MAG: hypothetical protein GC137_02790 [Alphaproteobacteria bacterium]|nr:hypothetical protein [Alphaproteobacteria bacterium]
MKKLVLIATVGLALTGCGFEPMYGSGATLSSGDKNIQSILAQVEIDNIPDRSGQILRNNLIDRFYRDGRPVNPDYVLKVATIKESTIDLDITEESDATRSQLRLSTTMSLVNKETGDIVLSRDINAVSSYNVLVSEFATRVSENSTRETVLNDLARQIELQIGLYLRR